MIAVGPSLSYLTEASLSPRRLAAAGGRFSASAIKRPQSVASAAEPTWVARSSADSAGLSKQEKVMSRFALYVPLQAKPGKEREVADFLRSAVSVVNAEAGTVSWFAIQEGPSAFAIFDTFDDEAGRDAHLNGKVAAALMEKARAGDLFAKTPVIHKLEILADKLPK
jgi:quinol monooxygenase YgiN